MWVLVVSILFMGQPREIHLYLESADQESCEAIQNRAIDLLRQWKIPARRGYCVREQNA